MPQQSANRMKHSKRTIVAALMILVVIPLGLFIGQLFSGGIQISIFNKPIMIRQYYFVSLFIIICTMIPFFMVFEKRKPQARELVVIAVLSAIAVAGRAAFFMIPQFKPVVAIVIITGVSFGAEAGFLVGAVTAFVSNFYFGQGPWTPWQMFCFGIIGFLAGILFKTGLLKKKKFSLCFFGAVATLLIYGGIMNPASLLMYSSTISKELLITTYIQGFPMDLIHAAATVFFLFFLSQPMIEKLDRIKIKYGLIEP